MHSTRDHRRIHVGDEQPLAAARPGLNDDVDAGSSPSSAARATSGAPASAGRRRSPPRSSDGRAHAAERVLGRGNIAAPSRSDAIKVAMNMASLTNPLSRLSRGRRRAASRRSRWRWPSATTGRSSTPTAPRSIATSASSRHGRRRRKRRARRTGSTAIATAPTPARPPNGPPTPGRRSRPPTRRPAADPRRRHRPLPAHLDRGDRAGAGDRSRDAQGGAGIAGGRGARGARPRGSEAAARIRPGDATRTARALEVVRSTGRTLKAGRTEKVGGIGDAVALRPLILLPPRDWLHPRCDERFEKIFSDEGIEEVRSLLERRLPGAGAGDAGDRRPGDRRLPARRDEPRGGARRRAGPRPANMPSANIPGSAASRRRTGRASRRRSIAARCRMP